MQADVVDLSFVVIVVDLSFLVIVSFRGMVKEQIGSWKAGKFLPLTSRPWSLYSYCLSRLWYRVSCLDIRAMDSSAISSSVKSWMYQDMLIKPQEIMLYRSTELGGLGLYNVRARSLAVLIHTFLLHYSPQTIT